MRGVHILFVSWSVHRAQLVSSPAKNHAQSLHNALTQTHCFGKQLPWEVCFPRFWIVSTLTMSQWYSFSFGVQDVYVTLLLFLHALHMLLQAYISPTLRLHVLVCDVRTLTYEIQGFLILWPSVLCKCLSGVFPTTKIFVHFSADVLFAS